MILNCTYITNADVGLFESNAKLNTDTGEVFDIETCTDDDQEHIEHVYSEEVSLHFNGKDYSFIVHFDDTQYALQSAVDLNTIQEAVLAAQR